MSRRKLKRDMLLLCQFFYPEHNSSAMLPYDTAVYLAQSGLSTDVMCGTPKEYTDQKSVPSHETLHGVNIHRIKYAQFDRKSRLGRLINYFSFTFHVLLHIREIGQHRAVMVYSNPPILPLAAVLANKLYGTEIIFVAYDLYPEIALAMDSIRAGSLIDRTMQFVNRSMFRRASRVVALTEEMKDRIAELHPEFPPGRIVTISNWAHEGTSPASAESYTRFGYAPEDFIVSYFGSMGICQEMETFLRAAEALKDENTIHFLIAGHGSKQEAVRTRTKSLVNVQVLDFITDAEFEQAMAISSCCVVTLEPGLKGLCAPSKYYSYLQAGKAVLSVTESDSYLAEEITRERLGAAVSVGDVTALAAAIKDLKANREAYAEMCRRAANLYRTNYSKELGLKSYAAMCRAVLEETAEWQSTQIADNKKETEQENGYESIKREHQFH